MRCSLCPGQIPSCDDGPAWSCLPCDLTVRLDPSFIAFRPTLSLCKMLGGAYHTTSLQALGSVARDGLVPGRGSFRLSAHLGCFAPFDTARSEATKAVVGEPRDEPVVILYIPSVNLLKFNTTISSSGVFLVTDTVPFSEFTEAWLGLHTPTN